MKGMTPEKNRIALRMKRLVGRDHLRFDVDERLDAIG